MSNLVVHEKTNLSTVSPQKGVSVFAAATPFQSSGELMYVPAGLNVAQILHLLYANTVVALTAHVYIGPDYIAPHLWEHVYPKEGAHLSISIVPQGGGGGKNPLRTILQIAVIAAAWYFAPALGATLIGSMGAGITTTAGVFMGVAVTASALGGFIITAVGTLLVNAIAPPSIPRIGSTSADKSDSQTLFIEGARNSGKRYDVVPVVLGRHRMVPPLAAGNVSEAVGSDQFSRQLFTWGYGDLVLTERQIGETAIANFSDVQTQDVLDGSSATVILSLYPSDIFEEQLSVKLSRLAPAGPIEEQIRTTQIKADEISVDILFPRGLVAFNSSGSRLTKTVEIAVETRLVDAIAWTPITSQIYTESTTAALRKTINFSVARGQYEVKVYRVTDDTNTDKEFTESYWNALRTITIENPVKFKGICLTALRIKATGQLNGSLDQYNAIVSNKIPAWNGSTWTIGETNNPADIFRYVASNSYAFAGGTIGPNAQPLADARVDLVALQNWHDYCIDQGFEYNSVIDFNTSVRNVLQEVAAAGRASISIKDGKWSVVVDRPQSIVAQHFTPKNTWGYSCSKTFFTMPHAFRCIFINEEIGYLQDERLVFDDGYDEDSATIIESINFPGITKPSLIWKHAREHLATLRLQPRQHQFFVDVEHLIAPRGKRCKLSHDLINVGITQGRIKEIITIGLLATGIIIDEPITMEAGKSYGVVIRTTESTELIKPVFNIGGITHTLSFVTPFNLDDSKMEITNLIMFGEAGKETIDIIVKEVIPETAFNVRIVAVDYNEAIFNASSGPIPAFNSGSTLPIEFQRPLAPILVVMQSNEEVQVINADGSISSRMVFTLTNDNTSPVAPEIVYRQANTNTFLPASVVIATPQQIVIDGLDLDVRYDFQIRYRRSGAITGIISNILSPPLEINNIEFIGTSTNPPDVVNFTANIVGQTTILSWDTVSIIDFSHYTIKFNPAIVGASWNNSAVLQDDIIGNNFVTPSQVGTYLIKAKDRTNNESDIAAVIANGVPISGLNVVETITENPVFAGAKDNVSLAFNVLELIDTSLAGYYYFNATTDLSEVYTSRLTPRLIATGNNRSNVMANWPTLSSVSSLSGAAPGAWAAEIQIRTTQTDPSAAPVWSVWQTLNIGDYVFRGAQFRVAFFSLNPDVTPTVSEVGVTIDMPDRIIRFEDKTIPIGGFNFVITPAYKKMLDIQVTGQNMSQGDYWRVTNKTASGAIITFYNNLNVSVVRVADIQFAGYGRVQ